jgi:hypothetical protein
MTYNKSIELILEELQNESEHKNKIKIIADYISEINKQHELEMEAEYDYDYVDDELNDCVMKSFWNYITSWFI